MHVSQKRKTFVRSFVGAAPSKGRTEVRTIRALSIAFAVPDLATCSCETTLLRIRQDSFSSRGGLVFPRQEFVPIVCYLMLGCRRVQSSEDLTVEDTKRIAAHGFAQMLPDRGEKRAPAWLRKVTACRLADWIDELLFTKALDICRSTISN